MDDARIRFVIAVLASFGVLACATSATGQSFGVGPRLSFVRGDLQSNTPSTSFIGGSVRLVGSRHHAIELSLDFRTVYNDARTVRTRETPLQASLLLYPLRAAFAPYVVGGFGVYREILETLDAEEIALTSSRAQQMGWHLGGGLEVIVSRRIGFYGDYRFRFVRLGEPEDDEEPIDVPVFGSVNLAHRGSMWTGGVTFYF